MTDDLPPLPWAHEYITEDNGLFYTALYTGQQMRAYARAAVETQRAENERLQKQIAHHRADYADCATTRLNQAEEIERLRALVYDASKLLTEIVRSPNAEHVADYHNAAVRAIKDEALRAGKK
jgi:hypothetical protein